MRQLSTSLEGDLSNIFENPGDEAGFKDRIKMRLEALLEDSDLICFGLDPRINIHATLESSDIRDLDATFTKYLGESMGMTKEQIRGIMKDWNGFRWRRGRFANNVCYPDYDTTTDPLEYWMYYRDSPLASIAFRMFAMITSSAAVERCFSRQKLIHSKNRNKLSADKINKMVTIAFSESSGTRTHASTPAAAANEETAHPSDAQAALFREVGLTKDDMECARDEEDDMDSEAGDETPNEEDVQEEETQDEEVLEASGEEEEDAHQLSVFDFHE